MTRTFDRTELALHDVHVERERQEAKCAEKVAEGLNWHTCASPLLGDGDRLAVLVEEIGEISRELCEARASGRPPHDNLREELVQAAAICVAWIEAIDTPPEIVTTPVGTRVWVGPGTGWTPTPTGETTSP